ncbi:MAG: hypothetical protein ACO3EK_15690, partial [Alphaproteobacteria bacterium]
FRLHLLGQLEQAHRVRDRGAAAAHAGGDLVLRQAKIIEQRSVRARFLERAGPAGLAGLVDAFVDSPLGSKDGIFAFWSRSGLLSVEARRGWVPPDLAPLDAARLEAPVDAGRGAT